MIAGIQREKNEQGRCDPVHEIHQGYDPAEDSKFRADHPVRIENDAHGQPAEEHHVHGLNLDLEAHRNSLPKNPLLFSWEFASR